MASSLSKKEKVVLLKSEDGELFEVGKDVAMVSKKVRKMMEEDDTCDRTEKVLDMTYGTGRIIARVIEYCLKHAHHKPNFWSWLSHSAAELTSWDQDFITSVHPSDLSGYILAADELEISRLLILACLRKGELAIANQQKEKKDAMVYQEHVLPTSKPTMKGLRYRAPVYHND